MGRKITAHEATIHTATVEVKTLTISGRQVTLSVFRQLPQQSLFVFNESDCSISLAGVPWGRVHYFPDECAKADRSTHLHVIWQFGDELRRSCVVPPHLAVEKDDAFGSLDHDYGEADFEVSESFIRLTVAQALCGKPFLDFRSKLFLAIEGCGSRSVMIDAGYDDKLLLIRVMSANEHGWGYNDAKINEFCERLSISPIAAFRNEDEKRIETERVYKKAKSDHANRKADFFYVVGRRLQTEANYTKLYEQLRGLTQLYIAT